MLQRSILEAPAASSNADSRNAGSRSWLNPPVDESSGRLSVSSAPKSWHRPCHGGGTEDAGPLKEKKQRKIATMDRLGLNLVARMKTHKKWSVYDERAMNLDRIRMVISGCSCKAACTSMFTEEEAMQICSAFRQMTSHDRHSVFSAMAGDDEGQQQADSAGIVDGDRVQGLEVDGRQDKKNQTIWNLLGRVVCVRGFCALLGMTQRTFYREINGALDLRRRIDELGALRPREKAQSAVCDRFFHDVYITCAEPLPQGSGTDRDADDSDLEAWVHEKAVVELTADVSHGQLDLTAREIPFATLCDLHLQFMAACETAGVSQVPCRATFARSWHAKWSKVLRFRYPSQHMQCQTCFELRDKTYNKWARPEDKLAWARLWRKHLRDQYEDRSVYWALRLASQAFDATVLVIIIDSMDKKKCVWPKYQFDRKPHEIDGLKARPRMTLTCGIAHGWCTGLFCAQETLSHGSNAFNEVLCIILSKVSQIARAKGRKFPSHLVIQADNTTGQTKNGLVASFMAQLVGMRKVLTATLNFLMVGHTHEDVDQVFAIVCELVVRRYRWETPSEFERALEAEMRSKIEARKQEFWVQGLRSIRDFNAWLKPQAVQLVDCWGSRNGIEAPHSFIFKTRECLSGSERSEIKRTRGETIARLAESKSDVFCSIKTYMRDKHLQQPPILILPASRRNLVVGQYPTTVEPLTRTPDRATQYLGLAAVFEKDKYGYLRAAQALCSLATDPVGPPVEPGWLAEQVPAQPPIEHSADAYFTHLPEISWHMRTVYNRLREDVVEH